jgi:trehalose 6-phosphate phosphatase
MPSFSAQPIPRPVPPPPLLAARAALFLDFDGTLAPLAQQPEDVQVHPELPKLLAAVGRRLGGALAIITGRRLEDVDRRLAPFTFGGAGLHGAELRPSAGGLTQLQWQTNVQPLVEALRARFGADARVLVEDKQVCVALHYRRAPERAQECRDAMLALARPPEFEVVSGSMVIEARPRGSNKGRALHALMDHIPFAGRRPVFVGDDVTDEDGFAAAARAGGYGIKVGPAETVAAYRIERPEDIFGWLQASLEAGSTGT